MNAGSRAQACSNHRSGDYSDPGLASRFAHLCAECAVISATAILSDFGILEAALARRARENLSDQWKIIHEAPIPELEGFRQVRANLAARMAEADARLEGAARELAQSFSDQKPKVLGDVLYVLDPPLGRGAGELRWVLGHERLFRIVQAGEAGRVAPPVELGVELPASPWPGRFFMIQDVPDPDRPGRCRGGFVEVTDWVRIQPPVKKDAVPEGSGPILV